MLEKHHSARRALRDVQLRKSRRALRDVQLRKSWRQPHATVTNSHRKRARPIIVVATITTIPRYVQRHTHQTTIQRELTEALANKTRLHKAQEGPLLNQRKGHAEVFVRRETGLVKMWEVECLLVSCMLQWCSSWQYGFRCQLVSVLYEFSWNVADHAYVRTPSSLSSPSPKKDCWTHRI